MNLFCATRSGFAAQHSVQQTHDQSKQMEFGLKLWRPSVRMMRYVLLYWLTLSNCNMNINAIHANHRCHVSWVNDAYITCNSKCNRTKPCGPGWRWQQRECKGRESLFFKNIQLRLEKYNVFIKKDPSRSGMARN